MFNIHLSPVNSWFNFMIKRKFDRSYFYSQHFNGLIYLKLKIFNFTVPYLNTRI